MTLSGNQLIVLQGKEIQQKFTEEVTGTWQREQNMFH